MLAFLFFGLLRAPYYSRVLTFIPYAIAAAIAYLTKGSMLILAPALCLLYFYRSRRIAVLLLFALSVGAAMLAWGMTTLNNTGQFSLTTMYTGYEIWKGNNPQTLQYFPDTTLDVLSAQAPRRQPDEDQWQWSRRARAEAIRYLRDNPREAGRLFLARIYQVFIKVTPETSESWSSGRFGEIRDYLKVLGIPFMLIFRIIFFCALIYAMMIIIRPGQRRPQHKDLFSATCCFLVFTAAFSAPFLIAWGTERRIIPMVIPTVLFVLYVLRNDASLNEASLMRRFRQKR